ncbi:LysR substrate-binding domain-containing protein [Rhodobium gokarnense]|uniref:DNA-binding transcriptional LysR family regulator n=1 Tax=Rhodobium gokarnense TaxID=364296 RepID=A0ABT3HAV8_9HYPH|nr:LysR substrate-binding domain-containing protein [Rhodobium gokarnense]MCW2307533.1 DNA-binding transcriptional LysR family regulator [Rhodobium gokarnense]
MNSTFDIDALRTMVAGLELGSFARAAVRLGRSQSAVSMQLKKLEQQAGTRLFERKGRGLVPTEAGEALAAYARRIVALNDEAARALGAATLPTTVRLGLPQDFFDDVMPATLATFSEQHPQVHVDVRAGPNHLLPDEVRAGRLDGAIVFFPEGTAGDGTRLGTMPMRWLAHKSCAPTDDPVPLVLFDHPCLFRQAALAALDRAERRWRAAVTTPSLPGIWGALRSGLGIAVRTGHGVPADIVCLGDDAGLPPLPAIDLKMLRSDNAPGAAADLCALLKTETLARVVPS